MNNDPNKQLREELIHLLGITNVGNAEAKAIAVKIIQSKLDSLKDRVLDHRLIADILMASIDSLKGETLVSADAYNTILSFMLYVNDSFLSKVEN